jgi:hypothetical protein
MERRSRIVRGRKCEPHALQWEHLGHHQRERCRTRFLKKWGRLGVAMAGWTGLATPRADTVSDRQASAISRDDAPWNFVGRRLAPLPRVFPGLLLAGRPLLYLETAAKLLKLLEGSFGLFSKCALKSFNIQTDFDSAIRRFDPSRPSQPFRRLVRLPKRRRNGPEMRAFRVSASVSGRPLCRVDGSPDVVDNQVTCIRVMGGYGMVRFRPKASVEEVATE